MQLPYDDRGVADTIRAQPLTLRGVANAAGVCTLTGPTVLTGETWLVDYAVITADTTAAPAFSMYDGEAALPNLLDGTTAGASAVAAYTPPRIISQGSYVSAVWTGCNPGDKCSIRLEYGRERDA